MPVVPAGALASSDVLLDSPSDQGDSSDAQSVGIYGIQIGMTPTEVISAIQTRHPHAIYGPGLESDPASKIRMRNKDKKNSGVIGHWTPGNVRTWESHATKIQFEIYKGDERHRRVDVELATPFGETRTTVHRIVFRQNLDRGTKFDVDDFTYDDDSYEMW